MPSSWYKHTIRVRYAETDQMGVVYHARYLDWFEVGRTEMIRQCGMEYRSLEQMGLLLPVMDLTVQYKKPARYDDWIDVCTRLTACSSVRLEFEYEIRRKRMELDPDRAEALSPVQGDLLVTGTSRHMWVNGQWRPARVDREAPELYALLLRVVQEAEGSDSAWPHDQTAGGG